LIYDIIITLEYIERMSSIIDPIRLTYKEKVPIISMKEIISTCLKEKLTGAVYDGINTYFLLLLCLLLNLYR